MAWKQISECLPAWLTATEMEKRADAEAPAKFTGQRQAGGEDLEVAANTGVHARALLDMSRWEYRAKPTRHAAASALYCHLRIVDGGRQAPGEWGAMPAGRTRCPEEVRERARELGLVVVR